MHGSEPRGWSGEILDGLAEGVVIFDADGAAVATNPAAVRILGGPDIYVGDPRRRIVREDGTPMDAGARPTAITRATGVPQSGVVVGLVTGDGAHTWIEIATRALGDPAAGPPFPLLASFADVTARVRAEHDARARAAELERLVAGDPTLLESHFDQSPVGMALLGPDLRFVRVNDAAAVIAGCPREAHLGRRPSELFGDDGLRMEERLRDVLETGVPLVDIEDEVRAMGAPGLRHLRASIAPLRDAGGEIVGLSVLVTDVTAPRRAAADRERTLDVERRAADRTARLQWVTVALTGALSIRDVAYVLAREATAAVDSEHGWVALLSADGRELDVVVRIGEPSGAAQRVAVDAALPGTDAVRDGRARFWSSGAELGEDYPALAAELGAAGVEAGAVVPIAGSRGAWGFLGLADTDRRDFTVEDRQDLEAIARLCGQALDRAAAFEHDHVPVERLAQSLLPDCLPDIPSIRLAWRLRPIEGPDAAVGGDFYDAFPVGRSSWLLVVGDVAGRGAEAAALTALVRYTVRAEALHDSGPRRLLHLVNAAILSQRSDLRLCTLVCARLDLDGGEAALTLSAAGHPDPLVLRADGTGTALHVPGSILGAFPSPELAEVELRLHPGDGLVLYTDGLLEAHAPERILTPGDLLREPLLGLPRPTPERLVDALFARAVDETCGSPRDDVAVLVAELAHP